MLHNVRALRNASAHSNCLINNLKKGNEKPSQKIIQFVSQRTDIGKGQRKTKLSNTFINDFVTLIYVYEKFVLSKETKKKRIKELKELFNNRMLRNKEYFIGNNCIKETYLFLKKIVDNLELT